MTNVERRSFAITRANTPETRDAGATGGDKLSGYAIVYNSDSYDLGGFIERVAPTALTRSLDAAAAGDLSIQAFWSHDSSQPLGSTRGGKLALASDDTGLSFELATTRFNPMQLDAARDGDLQMSFGFIVRADSWIEREDGVYERTLLDVDLFEVSPVISPAYGETSAALRSLSAWKEARTAVTVDVVAAEEPGTVEQVEEEPKQNVAMQIKRDLLTKAIDRRIAGK
jgi:HK97 family phage prohead protease